MQTDLFDFNKVSAGLVALSRVSTLNYHYNVRELVYQYEKVKLYHYQPHVKNPNKTPVLLVFATVNRPEILDLFPEQSFIGGLLQNGVDVYLLDWGYPDGEEKDVSFSDYVTHYLHLMAKFISEKSKQEKINLIGICQGGIICLCYAILFQHIKNLVLISTPIDFSTHDNVIAKFLTRLDVDEFVRITGNIPGPWLTQFFISLRPFELIGKKYLHFVDHLNNHALTEKFLQVEKWLQDAPDQTGASFSELVKDLYKENKLIKGEFYLNGQKIDLMNLTVPILNVMAKEDEIVPMSATRALKKYVGSKDYSQKIFPSGHIGIYISDKVGNRMTQAIAHWLKQRD